MADDIYGMAFRPSRPRQWRKKRLSSRLARGNRIQLMQRLCKCRQGKTGFVPYSDGMVPRLILIMTTCAVYIGPCFARTVLISLILFSLLTPSPSTKAAHALRTR